MEKFGAKEVCDVTVYDIKTGEPVLYLDTLKMSNLENTASSSQARGGKSNAKLLVWDYDREATFNVQDALLSTDSIGLLTGNSVVEGVKDIYKRQAEVVEASGASYIVTLEEDAVGTVHGRINGDVVTVTVDKVTAGSHTATFANVQAGDKVEVFYQYASDATAKTITISSDAFPGYYKIVGDTVVRNSETGEDEPFQIVVHKAKIQPAFTLNLQADGDPSVFDMNMEVFKRDQDTSMIEMVKY